MLSPGSSSALNKKSIPSDKPAVTNASDGETPSEEAIALRSAGSPSDGA